jgi:hypothetical protein
MKIIDRSFVLVVEPNYLPYLYAGMPSPLFVGGSGDGPQMKGVWGVLHPPMGHGGQQAPRGNFLGKLPCKIL